MKLEKITDEDKQKTINKHVIGKDYGCYFIKETPTVTVCGKGTFKKEYCDEHHLDVWINELGGGTIINCIGDIQIGLFKNNMRDVGKDFMQALLDFLATKAEGLSLDGNDLIQYGEYKLASCASLNIGGQGESMTFAGIQISMKVDLDLIKNICDKPMKKIPKGLTELGITEDEMLGFISEYEF